MKKTSYICLGLDPVAGCGCVLTAEERRYYGTSCEDCETVWSNRIDAWKSGTDDKELDAIFSVPFTVN